MNDEGGGGGTEYASSPPMEPVSVLTTVFLSAAIIYVSMGLYLSSVTNVDLTDLTLCIKTYGECACNLTYDPANATGADSAFLDPSDDYDARRPHTLHLAAATAWSSIALAIVAPLWAVFHVLSWVDGAPGDKLRRVVQFLGFVFCLLPALAFLAMASVVMYRIKNRCPFSADESWHFMSTSVGLVGIAWALLLVLFGPWLIQRFVSTARWVKSMIGNRNNNNRTARGVRTRVSTATMGLLVEGAPGGEDNDEEAMPPPQRRGRRGRRGRTYRTTISPQDPGGG